MIELLIRDILGKLQLLADGATQNLNPNKVTENAAKSKPPAGVRLSGAGEEPKKEHVSLYEFYRWQFDHHAGDERMLRTLWMLACDDYEDFRFKADHLIEVRKGEKVENDPKDPGAAERAQAKRVVDWYEGKPPLYVATREGLLGGVVTEKWVRKARLQFDRDSETGRPRPEFYGWDHARRKREIEALEALGLRSKAIAAQLGVDKNTVKRYMVVREPVAA